MLHAIQVARNNHVTFLETSAKNDLHVEEAFNTLLSRIVEKVSRCITHVHISTSLNKPVFHINTHGFICTKRLSSVILLTFNIGII